MLLWVEQARASAEARCPCFFPGPFPLLSQEAIVALVVLTVHVSSLGRNRALHMAFAYSTASSVPSDKGETLVV